MKKVAVALLLASVGIGILASVQVSAVQGKEVIILFGCIAVSY